MSIKDTIDKHLNEGQLDSDGVYAMEEIIRFKDMLDGYVLKNKTVGNQAKTQAKKVKKELEILFSNISDAGK